MSKMYFFAAFNTYGYTGMAQINFNSIYTAYYRKAFLFTLSYVHNDLVAEDIVSEAIIHLWELSKEREIPSVEAILITYIRSKSLNYLKHACITREYAGKNSYCFHPRSPRWKIP